MISERVSVGIESLVLDVTVDPITEESDVGVDGWDRVATSDSPSDGADLNVSIFFRESDGTHQRAAAVTLEVIKAG